MMDSPASSLPPDPPTLPSHGTFACLLCILLLAIPGVVFWTRARRFSSTVLTTGATTWAPFQYGQLTTTMWWMMHITHFGIYGTLHSKTGIFALVCLTRLFVLLAVWFYARMVITLVAPLWDEMIAKNQVHQHLNNVNNNNNRNYGSTPLSSSRVSTSASSTTVAENLIHNRSTSLYHANLFLLCLAIFMIAFSALDYLDDGSNKSLERVICQLFGQYFNVVFASLAGCTIGLALATRPSVSYSSNTEGQHWFAYIKLLLSIVFQMVLVWMVLKSSRDNSNPGQEWISPGEISVPAFLSIVLLIGDLQKEFFSYEGSSLV